MEILGVEFAPLNVSLNHRLQILAVAAWWATLTLSVFMFPLISYYLLSTRAWWLIVLYLLWIYIDKDVCEKGGRRIEWVRNLPGWYYVRDYFPLRLTKIPECKLDPKRNYLFGCFPHGILAIGALYAFSMNSSEFKELFPNHTPSMVTLRLNCLIPFFREIFLSIGGISSSAKSISYVLNLPEGGQVVALLPGGTSEIYFCQPGSYKIVLKKRKGFIRLALQAGAPVVPVVCFGETDLYGQVEGANLRRIQEYFRKIFGFPPVIPLGRGFFQYTFGLLPQRRPVTIVAGEPINVEKVEHPSSEQIDVLHQKFCEALEKLFEEEKYKYISNPEDTHLDIM